MIWWGVSTADGRNSQIEALCDPLDEVGIFLLQPVTFELNVRLDLSMKATTKSLCPLGTELLLQVLGESTRALTIRVIRGDEGVGDIPGIQGVSGESVGSAQYSSIDTRTQT